MHWLQALVWQLVPTSAWDYPVSVSVWQCSAHWQLLLDSVWALGHKHQPLGCLCGHTLHGHHLSIDPFAWVSSTHLPHGSQSTLVDSSHQLPTSAKWAGLDSWVWVPSVYFTNICRFHFCSSGYLQVCTHASLRAQASANLATKTTWTWFKPKLNT